MEIIHLNLDKIKALCKKENLIEFNRKISTAHVNKMSKSIQKCGLLRLPVIGDISEFSEKSHAIIDGQHLCNAILKLPTGSKINSVPVILKKYKSKKEMISDIAKLNNTQKKWSDTDYLEAWFRFGSENENFSDYAYLYNAHTIAFSDISIGVALEVYGGSKDSFREGNLKIKNKELSDKTMSLCKYLLDNFNISSAFMYGLNNFVRRRSLSKRDTDFEKLKSRLRNDLRSKKHVDLRHRDDFTDFIERSYTRL